MVTPTPWLHQSGGMVLHLPNIPDILTHMMNPVPKFNCTYAALDTSTAEEDEDD